MRTIFHFFLEMLENLVASHLIVYFSMWPKFLLDMQGSHWVAYIIYKNVYVNPA